MQHRQGFIVNVYLQVAPVKVTLDDLDDLIAALSPEELGELSRVDPDVSILRYEYGHLINYSAWIFLIL